MILDTRASLVLTGRTLQVIVKLADIVLTPDKSRYPDGSWHVELMLNERDTYFESSHALRDSGRPHDLRSTHQP